VEVVILEKIRFLENGGKWKSLWLWRKGNKGKGKMERNDKEKIFSWNQNRKILKGQIPGLKSRIRKTYRKIPKSSEIQVSRNDSQFPPKINNNIRRLKMKSFLRNTL